ncbi:MAG: iron-sulfur cluster insertion protein ErpA [Acidobacteria bacterium]|uniref:Iron-sulfur cluster insertion protein ErpA n=1 Tax=Candidatus Polarisedimenticola svalbardensis TaxID=2886004 RepID=A0A8J7C1T0_9BACT|nr:iron-sulfur cluster insertion protein ErpA [Candidatus Polarisedimenticola svalbardensis]
MVNLTDKAVEKVKQLMSAEGKEGYGLRVAVKGGGCSGFEYGLTFEESAGEKDKVLEVSGLQVFLDDMSQLYLNGTSIDYVDSLAGSGFKIDNPQSSGSCGCGNSFSV